MDTFDEYAVDDRLSHARHRAIFLKLSLNIDTESTVTIGCAGAVLAFLQRKRSAHYLPGDEAARSAFRVSAIANFNLNRYLSVSIT